MDKDISRIRRLAGLTEAEGEIIPPGQDDEGAAELQAKEDMEWDRQRAVEKSYQMKYARIFKQAGLDLGINDQEILKNTWVDIDWKTGVLEVTARVQDSEITLGVLAKISELGGVNLESKVVASTYEYTGINLETRVQLSQQELQATPQTPGRHRR